MRETSDVWKRLVAAKHTNVEYKFIINGVEHTEADEEEHEVHKTLFESFGIGNATIAQLNLSIYAESIPSGAKIERMMRLASGDGQTVSDWMPAGVFFASRRALDDGKWTVEAYDSMRKAGTVWVPDQSLEFPMTMPDAVAEFCRIMDVELDPRTVLNAEYTIDYPTNDYTIRNCLCFVGTANCGNWVITPEGKLYLVPLIPTGTPHAVGLDLMQFVDNGARKAVTRVTLKVDSEQVLTAGGDYGVEVVADCPYATQTMVNALLAKLEGFVYHPYEAVEAMLDPAAELGDLVEVGDITSIIVTMDDDGEGFPDISAPGGQELNDEYPEIGPMSQEINRKLAETRSQLTKTASEINAKVEATDGRLAQLQIEVDGITLEVTSVSTSGGKTYARIRLKGGNGEWQEGQILLDGNVNVSGQLSAEALYAALGDVANLMVNRLSTSRRIPKYLARDTSDDRYFYIANEEQCMRRAWTDGSTEQARTPDGALLYWEQDISAATLGGNGYPFIDGAQVATTTTESPYPVMVYVYQEGDRWKQTFAEDGNYGPRQIWGEGDGTSSGRGRGYLEKLGLLFSIYNLGTDGVKRGMFMGNDYTDITGLRKVTKLDMSMFRKGRLTFVLDGNIQVDLSTTFDSDGRVSTIADDSGHVMEVIHPE